MFVKRSESLRVGQAIFGEWRGGHALREATGDRVLAAELASRLDLPDTAPSGVVWSPFTSGFPLAEQYVLARTFLHPEAPRTGMVLSHALIVPLQEIIHFSDLRPLFARLIMEAKQPTSLSSFDLALQEKTSQPPPELVGAAEALTTRGTGPVVWSGLERFDDLAIALRAQLWPAIRRSFGFRLSFDPSDVVESPAPTGMHSRCAGHTLAGVPHHRSDSARAHNAIGDAVGWSGPGHSLDRVCRLDRRGNYRADRPSAAGTSLPARRARAPYFSHTTAAIRLIDKLSPDPARGVAAKLRMLERFGAQVDTADANAM
jgi:hypothetical protein